MNRKRRINTLKSYDFGSTMEMELSKAFDNFLKTLIFQFKEYDLDCVILKRDKEISNVHLSINGVPMRLIRIEHNGGSPDSFYIVFQQRKIIVRYLPELALTQDLKQLFPQKSFYNVEDIADHFKQYDLVNILKDYAKINGLARTGVFENISHGETEDDNDKDGHFSVEYSKLLEDANYKYLDRIIELFHNYNIECEYDDEGVPASGTPIMYFHVAGIPMELNAKSKMKFGVYQEIIKDRPELKLVDKNIFYENSSLRSFFSVQELVEYFKKHDLLNTKLAPIARTGIFEKQIIDYREKSLNDFRTIEENIKKKIEPLFNEEIVKIFNSKGLKCECVDINAYEPYLLIEGLLMKILNRNRMIFASHEEMLKYLPSLSLTNFFKKTDNKVSILSDWNTFYSIDDIVDYFKEHDIVKELNKVKNLNPLAKSGVFERIKSFKDFGKE